MYIFYVINSALVESGVVSSTNSVCVVLAVLLHYFLLASFVWMLVIAYIQYIMFVKVFQFHVTYFTLKAALISWSMNKKNLFLKIYFALIYSSLIYSFIYFYFSLFLIKGIPLIPIIISVSLNYTPNVVNQMKNNFIYGNIGSNM
jgi:hypothetical protein